MYCSDIIRFNCQRGPDECAGNKIHSCGLYFAETQAQRVEFVACQMNYGAQNTELVRKFRIS